MQLLSGLFEMDLIEQDEMDNAMSEGYDDIIEFVEAIPDPNKDKVHLFTEDTEDDNTDNVAINEEYDEPGFDLGDWGDYNSEYSD